MVRVFGCCGLVVGRTAAVARLVWLLCFVVGRTADVAGAVVDSVAAGVVVAADGMVAVCAMWWWVVCGDALYLVFVWMTCALMMFHTPCCA